MLQRLKQIIDEYGLTSLNETLKSIEELSKDDIIDFAVLGQFKAGKSSFLNSLIGKDVLPTGVVPLTSVITRIQYGKTEKATCYFLSNNSKQITLNEISDYVTESKNPKNVKNVTFVDIELPGLEPFPSIRFIDTPGIGSIFRHNTDTTESWFAKIGIAFVVISAERPLGENEISLIREVTEHCPEIIILLTKTDLFREEQIAEILSYIDTQLNKEFGKTFPVYCYSITAKTDEYRNKIISEVVVPVIKEKSSQKNKILKHKAAFLVKKCISYFEISVKTSQQSDEEREKLRKEIFDEKTNTVFIRQELQMLASNHKSQTRERVFALLEKYEDRVISDLQQSFSDEYYGWSGNLYTVSRKYEEWLKNSLKTKLGEIARNEQPALMSLLNQHYSHFNFFTSAFKARLMASVKNVLGISLTDDDWKPQLKPLKQPDISVYRAFDSHIDMLWFLIPMFVFRKFFFRYFSKQIKKEVQKNIQRLTSDLNEIINKEIDSIKEQTLNYLITELTALEKSIESKESRSGEFQKILEELKQLEE